MTRFVPIMGCLIAAAVAMLPTAAEAQRAGDFVVRAGAARTKLVDKGEITVGGVLEPFF